MATEKYNDKINKKKAGEFRGQILKWYDKNHRVLPWRAGRGETPDPYRVWLSEIMLQQTTVAAVIPYFSKFTRKWPNVQALAAAKQEEVMSEWAGLGYYARARNLHKCARIVANDLGGAFPQEQEALKKLPGIGDYTSAAIAAIAFNRPANVVDGNIERIIARYFLIEEPLSDSKKKLKSLAGALAQGETKRPGDYAQGLMDLGAGICMAQSPKCGLCPVSQSCQARERGAAVQIPAKKEKKNKPLRKGFVYWIENEKGEVLIHHRPSNGLLGGMKALPTSEWVESRPHHPSYLAGAKKHKFRNAAVRHSFTHFDLKLDLFKVLKINKKLALNDCRWYDKDGLKKIGFPTVFNKAFTLFCEDQGQS